MRVYFHSDYRIALEQANEAIYQFKKSVGGSAPQSELQVQD
jgi:hypothetical protein